MRYYPETERDIGMSTPAPSPVAALAPQSMTGDNAMGHVPSLQLPKPALRFAAKHTVISQPQRTDAKPPVQRQPRQRATTSNQAGPVRQAESPPVLRAFTDEERALNQAQMALREEIEQREWDEQNVDPEEQRMRDAMGPWGRFEIGDMRREMRLRMEAMELRITELRRRGDRAHKRVQKELAVMASRTKDLSKAVEKLSLDKKEEGKENMDLDKE